MDEKARTGLEIERKYIIKMPLAETLSSAENYSRSEILQIYLPSEQGETRRVRRRTSRDTTVYTETVKRRVDRMSSVETEREISRSEFERLSEHPLQGCAPIIKTRHTFLYLGQLFEIDVYPRWQSTAIMETELNSRESRVQMPDFIEIVKEVTGDKSYSNAGMARAFPEELKIPHI